MRVVRQDAPVGHLERAPEVGIGVGAGLLDLDGGDAQPVGHVDLVQFGGVADQGLVALGADLPQDFRHHVVDVGPGGGRARQDRLERRRRAAQVQGAEGHGVTRLPVALTAPFPPVAWGAPGPLAIGHHRGMSSAAEISSISSTLTELHDRVTALAESSLASGDEDMAHELIAVERALGGALRRLRRFAAGQGPGR